VASEVDEEEEATEHAKREGNVADEDSIDTDTEEGLDEITDELEEAIDVLTRDSKLLVSKLALGFLVLLEVSDTYMISKRRAARRAKKAIQQMRPRTVKS